GAKRSCSGCISRLLEIELSAGSSSTFGPAPLESAPKRMVFPRQFHSSVRVSIALTEGGVRSADLIGTITAVGRSWRAGAQSQEAFISTCLSALGTDRAMEAWYHSPLHE